MRGRENGQQLEPNSESISNTITTVQKDNLLLTAEPEGKTSLVAEQSRACTRSASYERWQHRVHGSGDSRPCVSDKQNEERQSDRKRKCMSDSDNGEYP